MQGLVQACVVPSSNNACVVSLLYGTLGMRINSAKHGCERWRLKKELAGMHGLTKLRICCQTPTERRLLWIVEEKHEFWTGSLLAAKNPRCLLKRHEFLARAAGGAPPWWPAGYCSPLPATAASDAQTIMAMSSASAAISISQQARGANNLSRRLGGHHGRS